MICKGRLCLPDKMRCTPWCHIILDTALCNSFCSWLGIGMLVVAHPWPCIMHFMMHGQGCVLFACINSLRTLNWKAPSQVTYVSLSKAVRHRRPTLRVSWIAPQSDVIISEDYAQYRRSLTSWSIKPSSQAHLLQPLIFWLHWMLAQNTTLEWEQYLLPEMETGVRCRQREFIISSLHLTPGYIFLGMSCC